MFDYEPGKVFGEVGEGKSRVLWEGRISKNQDLIDSVAATIFHNSHKIATSATKDDSFKNLKFNDALLLAAMETQRLINERLLGFIVNFLDLKTNKTEPKISDE